MTPDFKGTHLWDRLCWAKEHLEPHQSDYRVVYEDSIDECAKILVADPNWMACALQGGILPPVWADDRGRGNRIPNSEGCAAARLAELG
jgi:hypothetical protein